MQYSFVPVNVASKSNELHGLQCMLHVKTVVLHGFQPCNIACYMGNCQITWITEIFQCMLPIKVVKQMNYMDYSTCYM